VSVRTWRRITAPSPSITSEKEIAAELTDSRLGLIATEKSSAQRLEESEQARQHRHAAEMVFEAWLHSLEAPQELWGAAPAVTVALRFRKNAQAGLAPRCSVRAPSRRKWNRCAAPNAERQKEEDKDGAAWALNPNN